MDVVDLIERLASAFPWLSRCVNEIDVTNIGAQHSLKQMLEEASRPLDIELDGFALSPAPENEVEPRPRNTVRLSKQRKKPYSQER